MSFQQRLVYVQRTVEESTENSGRLFFDYRPGAGRFIGYVTNGVLRPDKLLDDDMQERVGRYAKRRRWRVLP